jgi:hypothetical protein
MKIIQFVLTRHLLGHVGFFIIGRTQFVGEWILEKGNNHLLYLFSYPNDNRFSESQL